MKNTGFIKHYTIHSFFVVVLALCFSYNFTFAAFSQNSHEDRVEFLLGEILDRETDNGGTLADILAELQDQVVSDYSSILTSISSKLDSLISLESTIGSYITNLASNLVIIRDHMTTARISDTADVVSVGAPPLSGSYRLQGYQLPWYVYSDERITLTTSVKYCNFIGMLSQYWQAGLSWMQAFSEMFREWFYPLKSSDETQYWRVWNTDTDQYEAVNPATVTGYITYYLGELYRNTILSDAVDKMNDAAAGWKADIEHMESSEKAVTDSVQSHLDNFMPDIADLGGFKAVSWVTNYLQLCFVQLGAYGTVIVIGLMLALCMQFIGMFHYKS